jgi:hypothetical protein
MTVLLVLLIFALFIGIDYLKSRVESRVSRIEMPLGTCYTTPGFEMLGCLSQDGGDRIENDYEI